MKEPDEMQRGILQYNAPDQDILVTPSATHPLTFLVEHTAFRSTSGKEKRHKVKSVSSRAVTVKGAHKWWAKSYPCKLWISSHTETAEEWLICNDGFFDL